VLCEHIRSFAIKCFFKGFNFVFVHILMFISASSISVRDWITAVIFRTLVIV
jgi:hypothetical protein